MLILIKTIYVSALFKNKKLYKAQQKSQQTQMQQRRVYACMNLT